MKPQYYLLDGHKPVACASVLKWARQFEKMDRVVGYGEFHRFEWLKLISRARVSTVFLGFDHAFGGGLPKLFETMIFGGPNDEYQRRYSTWEEAEAGHAEACKIAL